jgi:hypothetical protein
MYLIIGTLSKVLTQFNVVNPLLGNKAPDIRISSGIFSEVISIKNIGVKINNMNRARMMKYTIFPLNILLAALFFIVLEFDTILFSIVLVIPPLKLFYV